MGALKMKQMTVADMFTVVLHVQNHCTHTTVTISFERIRQFQIHTSVTLVLQKQLYTF